MPEYRRATVGGATYFFTVILQDRRPLLCEPEMRLALRQALRAVRSLHPFGIDAWVLLPDHLHCLWTLPPGDAGYALRWSLIKSAVSRRCAARIMPSLARTPSQIARNETGLWQRRFWEHLIRDDTERRRHADYIHWNPVKHGYVQRPVQWEFSTFHRFVRAGVYPRDWGVGVADDDGPFGE